MENRISPPVPPRPVGVIHVFLLENGSVAVQPEDDPTRPAFRGPVHLAQILHAAAGGLLSQLRDPPRSNLVLPNGPLPPGPLNGM